MLEPWQYQEVFHFSFVNVDLLKSAEIRPTLELRSRLEHRSNRDFDSNQADRRNDHQIRLRPGLTFKPSKRWDGALQYQFAYNEIQSTPKISDVRISDLSLGFVRFTEEEIRLTAGRQRLNVGSERLIGQLDWSLSGRSFDGLRGEMKNLDMFAAKVGVFSPRPRRDYLAGAQATSKFGKTLIAYKHSEVSTGKRDIWCLDQSLAKTFGLWEIDFEGAIQAGAVQGKSHRAWAMHLKVSNKIAVGTNIFSEVNAASGGNNSKTSSTFDNFYPSNHKYYGTMDLQGWKNMNELSFGIDHQVNKKVIAKASWHAFWLRNARDSWYGANGNPNPRSGGIFQDPTGRSGRDVGQELDFEINFAADKHTSLQGGISVFIPGTFIKRLSGKRDSQVWMFLAANYKW